VIYSTAPVSMIVGEVEVTGTVGGSPEEVWQQTAELSGISKELFDSYYAGKEKAIAYRLGEVSKYESPKRLADVGVTSAPSLAGAVAWAKRRTRIGRELLAFPLPLRFPCATLNT